VIDPELEEEGMEFIPDNDQPRPDPWRIEDLIVSGEFGSKRVWRGEVVIGWTVPLTGANPRGKEESLLKSLQIRGDESVITRSQGKSTNPYREKFDSQVPITAPVT